MICGRLRCLQILRKRRPPPLPAVEGIVFSIGQGLRPQKPPRGGSRGELQGLVALPNGNWRSFAKGAERQISSPFAAYLSPGSTVASQELYGCLPTSELPFLYEKAPVLPTTVPI